jgi:hypothetical protein
MQWIYGALCRLDQTMISMRTMIIPMAMTLSQNVSVLQVTMEMSQASRHVSQQQPKQPLSPTTQQAPRHWRSSDIDHLHPHILSQFLAGRPNVFATSSSRGNLALYRIEQDDDSNDNEWSISLTATQPRLKHLGAANALSIDQSANTIATVGDDGKVLIYHTENESESLCMSQ